MKKEVSMTIQVKTGGKYVETYKTMDKETIYRNLSRELTGHYICKASYIKRVKRTPNYDGTETIIVTFDNESRAVYIVENY